MSPSSPHDPPELRFLQHLARDLHVYGLPSHRLEESLRAMTQTLGVDAEFLVTPTSIVWSYGSQTRLMRIDQGETHLERLSELDRIMREVQRGTLDVASAADQVERLPQQPERYGPVISSLAFPLASATAAVFFGGGWRESVGAAAVGGAIALLAWVATRSRRVHRLLPALAAFLAVTIAHGMSTILSPLFPFLSTLAGLIILIPGLSLTVAMNELAHQHLVSGTARLMGALTTFLQLGFGAAIGWHVAPELFGEILSVTPEALPSWAPWATLPITAIALTVLFRGTPRDYFAVLAGATVAFAGARWGSVQLGPEIGMAVGAWGLGCTSTVLARIRRRPAAISLLPGLLLLVPGTLGIRSLQALVTKNVPDGIEAAFTMALIAISLVVGLFLANLTFRPRPL